MKFVNKENLIVGETYYSTESKDTCFRFHHFIRHNHQNYIAMQYVSGATYYSCDENGFYIFSSNYWWKEIIFKFGR